MCKRMLLSLLLLVCGSIKAEMQPESGDDNEAVKGRCKTYQNLTVCSNLRAGTLNVTGNETIGGRLTISNSFPQIALANGGNLLDYASFSFTGETTIATGAAAVLSDASNISSAGITLAVNNQTITFANAGVYLLSGYMVGQSDAANTGFSFVFANPTATSIVFSGGVQTASVITTMSGTAVAVIAAGQTMTLNNASSGTFSLFDADVPGGARTVGVTIVRLQ